MNWPPGTILHALGGPHFAWPNDGAPQAGSHEPTAVRIVEYDAAGSNGPDPAFDQGWDKLTALCWRAGLVLARTGLRVVVVATAEEPVLYGFTVGRTSMGCSWDYRGAWDMLLGMEVGASAVQEHVL